MFWSCFVWSNAFCFFTSLCGALKNNTKFNQTRAVSQSSKTGLFVCVPAPFFFCLFEKARKKNQKRQNTKRTKLHGVKLLDVDGPVGEKALGVGPGPPLVVLPWRNWTDLSETGVGLALSVGDPVGERVGA